MTSDTAKRDSWTINDYSDYWFYKIGINILPLDTNKTTYENWKDYQNNPISSEIHEEWKKNGRYNKGIVLMLGKVWRGDNKGLYFIGIDFDKELGFKEFCNLYRENITIKELKENFIVEQHDRDHNSFHVYFYSEIPFTDKNADNVLGIEIKSNGKGLMCATPSYHFETKSRWEIKGTDSPIILKSEESLKLMLDINDICRKHNVSYLKLGKDDSIYFPPLIKEMINSLKINLDAVIMEGERHFTLLRIANSLLFKYWTIESNAEERSKILNDLLKFFYEINDKLCKPKPISEKELKSIWISCLDYVKRNNKDQKITTSNKGKSKPKFETQNVLIKKATEKLMDKYNFLTIEESKDILFYENGVYKKGGEIIIEKELETMFGYSLKISHIYSIIGHIKRRTYIKSNEFDKNLNIINMKNGLYNLQTEKLEPHSSNYPSLKQKPILYDPTTKSKLFGPFLQQILYPKDIRTAVEMLAYTFIQDNPYELFTILLGIGDNGKNVYTGILSSLHGFNNISNISLKSIAESNFAIAGLENKDVNIDTELPQGAINDISTIKKLTGKQPISIERKGKDAYDAKLHAKLFFSTNKLPNIKDTSDGKIRREVIIPFPNQFQEGINADPKLVDKLTTEEEKSGIFNILMKALKAIQKYDKIYLDQKTIVERRRKYDLLSDPIGSFIKDTVAQDSICDDFVVKADFHLSYKNYCNYHKLPFENIEKFGEILKREYHYNDGRKTIGNKRKTIWIGIKLVKWVNIEPSQKILITEKGDIYNDDNEYYDKEDNSSEEDNNFD